MSDHGEATRPSAIEEDHLELRGRLDALADAASHAGILAGMKDLPRMLAKHFAQEELEGGLYDDLALRAPALCPQLDALRAEHRAMLEEFEALSREIHSQVGAEGTASEETRHAVARCADRLRAHEHAESSMIADVYYTDEGGRG